LASLVLADFIARLFSTIGLVRASLHFKRDLLQSHNVLDLQAKPNIDFVKHIFPASMFDVFTINLLPLLIALAFSYEEAGLYSLTSRIFSLPSTLLAASLGSVLLHRFSRMQNRSPLHVASLYGKILTTLMAIGFFTALTFYVYSDEIVDELLGSKWVQVSDVSRAISFYLGVNVAWAVLNGLFAAFQRWHEYLRVSQLRFALAFISWPICFLFSLSFAQTILVVTLGLGLAQLWGLIWLLGRIRRSP
jgi:O-antigen/teichoic acid export membrane protein